MDEDILPLAVQFPRFTKYNVPHHSPTREGGRREIEDGKREKATEGEGSLFVSFVLLHPRNILSVISWL